MMLKDTHFARIERVLNDQLPNADTRIAQAMRYSTLDGGKRLRALLVYACAQDFGVENAQVDAAAAAIECIHAYSLIHDDLPAMDDDNLRRGKASNHIAFDQATAILAGDALNTLAFELLSHSALKADTKIIQIQQLSHAAGVAGMIGGQMLDIIHTDNPANLPTLEKIHYGKTAALFIAALHLGAAPSAHYHDHSQTLNTIGHDLGMAFQIIDDILDSSSDSATLGKTAGKDSDQNKHTYVTLLGIEDSRQRAIDYSLSAIAATDTLPNQGKHLGSLIRTMSERRY